jgi:hypothetical protein
MLSREDSVVRRSYPGYAKCSAEDKENDRRRGAVGLFREVFRRRTCDTRIWTKPQRFAADVEMVT